MTGVSSPRHSCQVIGPCDYARSDSSISIGGAWFTPRRCSSGAGFTQRRKFREHCAGIPHGLDGLADAVHEQRTWSGCGDTGRRDAHP